MIFKSKNVKFHSKIWEFFNGKSMKIENLDNARTSIFIDFPLKISGILGGISYFFAL